MKKSLCLLLLLPLAYCSIKQNLSKRKLTGIIQGKWEIIDYGEFWEKAGYASPSIFIFQEDGTYLWQYTIDGSFFSAEGRYLLTHRKESPHALLLEQRILNGKALQKTCQGSLVLSADKILTLYLHDPRFPTKELSKKFIHRYRKIY